MTTLTMIMENSNESNNRLKMALPNICTEPCSRRRGHCQGFLKAGTLYNLSVAIYFVLINDPSSYACYLRSSSGLRFSGLFLATA